MDEIRRFDVYCNGGWDGCTTYEDNDALGDYVAYDDHSKLVATLRAENERLKGEVERLREALTKISRLYWIDAPYPDEMREIARIALLS